MSIEVCIWQEDESGLYESSCKHAFQFNDGHASDNGFLFCPYCGKRMEDRCYTEKPEDDEEILDQND